MELLDLLIALLVESLKNPSDRRKLINEFQTIVWDRQGDEEPEYKEEWTILRDLANDLDYYEPDPVLRSADPAYYGDARLEDEIKSTLAKVRLQ